MKRLQLAAATALAAASLTLASAAPPDEPADGFVFDAMTAPQTVSYAGTVETIGIGDQHSDASVYRIEHRAPNLTQRVYLSPPKLKGDSLVSNGEDSYFVDIRRHRVVATENDASNDQIARDDNYLLLRANYRAVKRSTESFDGRAVRDVALINKYTNRTTMLVRVDEQTKLVLDKQQFAPDGAMVSQMRFEEVSYSPNIPSADFDIPKSFTVVQGPRFGDPSQNVSEVVRGIGFAAKAPKFLPDGFSPVEGKAIEIKGVRTLHLLYSDGIRTVSLFENTGTSELDLQRLHPQAANVSGRDAQYAERGPTTLLTWTDGNLRCALVGEMPLDELEKIAASLAP